MAQIKTKWTLTLFLPFLNELVGNLLRFRGGKRLNQPGSGSNLLLTACLTNNPAFTARYHLACVNKTFPKSIMRH